MSLNAQLHTGRTNGRRALATLAFVFVVVVLVVAGVATWQEHTGHTSLNASLDGAIASGAATPAVTTAEFLRRANDVCKTADLRTRRLHEPSGTADTLTRRDLATWTPFLRAYIGIGADLVKGLRALPQPDQASSEFAQLLALTDNFLAALRNAEAAAAKGDVTAFKRSLMLIVSYGDAMDGAAKQVGLTSCSGES